MVDAPGKNAACQSGTHEPTETECREMMSHYGYFFLISGNDEDMPRGCLRNEDHAARWNEHKTGGTLDSDWHRVCVQTAKFGKDEHKAKRLESAVRDEKWDSVIQLVNDGANVNHEWRDEDGRKRWPLAEALINSPWGDDADFFDAVKLLVEKGAEVNREWDAYGGKTFPLQEASSHNQWEVVKLLAEHATESHVNHEWDDSGEKTCILQEVMDRVSWKEEAWDVVKVLVERGADVNRGLAEGEYLSDVAAREKRWDVLKLVYHKGAKVTQKGNDRNLLAEIDTLLDDRDQCKCKTDCRKKTATDGRHFCIVQNSCFQSVFSALEDDGTEEANRRHPQPGDAQKVWWAYDCDVWEKGADVPVMDFAKLRLVMPKFFEGANGTVREAGAGWDQLTTYFRARKAELDRIDCPATQGDDQVPHSNLPCVMERELLWFLLRKWKKLLALNRGMTQGVSDEDKAPTLYLFGLLQYISVANVANASLEGGAREQLLEKIRTNLAWNLKLQMTRPSLWFEIISDTGFRRPELIDTDAVKNMLTEAMLEGQGSKQSGEHKYIIWETGWLRHGFPLVYDALRKQMFVVNTGGGLVRDSTWSDHVVYRKHEVKDPAKALEHLVGSLTVLQPLNASYGFEGPELARIRGTRRQRTGNCGVRNLTRGLELVLQLLVSDVLSGDNTFQKKQYWLSHKDISRAFTERAKQSSYRQEYYGMVSPPDRGHFDQPRYLHKNSAFETLVLESPLLDSYPKGVGVSLGDWSKLSERGQIHQRNINEEKILRLEKSFSEDNALLQEEVSDGKPPTQIIVAMLRKWPNRLTEITATWPPFCKKTFLHIWKKVWLGPGVDTVGLALKGALSLNLQSVYKRLKEGHLLTSVEIEQQIKEIPSLLDAHLKELKESGWNKSSKAGSGFFSDSLKLKGENPRLYGRVNNVRTLLWISISMFQAEFFNVFLPKRPGLSGHLARKREEREELKRRFERRNIEERRNIATIKEDLRKHLDFYVGKQWPTMSFHEFAAKVYPTAAATDSAWKIGDIVKARWINGSKWYGATIKECNTDGTYRLKYDDGDVWAQVPAEKIIRDYAWTFFRSPTRQIIELNELFRQSSLAGSGNPTEPAKLIRVSVSGDKCEVGFRKATKQECAAAFPKMKIKPAADRPYFVDGCFVDGSEVYWNPREEVEPGEDVHGWRYCAEWTTRYFGGTSFFQRATMTTSFI